MTALIAIVLLAFAIFLVWRIFKVASGLRPTAEPPDEGRVREPVPRRPLNRRGAVAIDEADDETNADACAGR
jgi:hypothetical protein